MSERYVGWRCGRCDEPIAGRFSKCPHCGFEGDIGRTERLLAALREAGETAFRALNGQRGEVLTTAYREAVGRLMVEWCREHGEDELATIFEREGKS